jgi:hypothetical protein
MNTRREDRVAGWAGVVFSVLSLIVIPLAFPPPPALGASGPVFAEWYGAHRWGFLIGNYLGIAAFIPGLLQLAIVAHRIKRAEAEKDGWLGPLVIASGTFTYAVFGCSLVVFQTLPFLTSARLEGPMEAMGSFATIWFALDGLAALPLVLAVGWAVLATGFLPSWFARFSWLVAVLCLVMSLGSLTSEPAWLAGGEPATALGFVAFFGWTLTLAILFLRRARETT